MSINIVHGDISAALGLAQQAGAGIAQQRQRATDMDFIRMMQQAQAQADAEHANEISQGIGVQEFNAGLDMKQQSMQQAAQQQQIENQQANTRLTIAQQNANNSNTNAQARINQSQDRYDTRQDAINQLPQDVQPVVRATGRMPYQPNGGTDHSFQQLEAEAKRYNAMLQQKMKELNSYIYDDRRDLGYKDQGNRLPDGGYVIKGMEKKYSDAKIQAQQLQAKVDELNGALTGRTNSLTGQAGPVVDESTVNKMVTAQQAQPVNNSSGGGSPPVVHDAQEYAQVPSGTTYIWAGDGQSYVKK
jgi:hypothetical protein